MKAFVVVAAMAASLLVAVGDASPRQRQARQVGLHERELQLMAIAEGAQQLSLLAGDMWQYAQQVAAAVPSGSDVARSLQRDDPVQLMLNTVELDSDTCRRRVVCELQQQMTGSTLGSLLYELVKSRVPQLQKYGYVSARDLGADSCSAVFSCRLADSPLMQRALEVRQMASEVCDMEANSFTGWMCRSTVFLIDWMETL